MGVVPVSRPVNVALVIVVCEVKVKSSADSISNGAPVPGRDAVAIRPSGAQGLKVNVPAAAGIAVIRQSRAAAPEAFTMEDSITPPYIRVVSCGAYEQNSCHLDYPRLIKLVHR